MFLPLQVDELAFNQALSTLKDYNIRKVQEIATLREEVLKSQNEISRLKEHLSELEVCKKKELEECNEKMKWQMDKLLKCDKEKQSLEAKVSILMNQIEVLSNDRDTKISTLESDLKVKDEQIITANVKHLKARNELAQLQAAMMTLEVEFKNSHLECGNLNTIIVAKSEELKICSQNISELNAALLREKEGRASVDTELKKAEEEIVKLKQDLEHHVDEATRINEDSARLRQESEELLNRCKDQNAELVKQTEVKVIECDKQLQEISSLQDQVVVLTGKCEASQNHELLLELELKKQRCECASLREALQSESTNLKEEIMKLKVYQNTNKQQSQTLHRLKEELNIAKVNTYTIMHSI